MLPMGKQTCEIRTNTQADVHISHYNQVHAEFKVHYIVKYRFSCIFVHILQACQKLAQDSVVELRQYRLCIYVCVYVCMVGQ
jgi:hypothetical protein